MPKESESAESETERSSDSSGISDPGGETLASTQIGGSFDEVVLESNQSSLEEGDGLDLANSISSENESSEVDPSASKLDKSDSEPKEDLGSFLRELPGLLLMGFGIVVLLNAFLIRAFTIPSGSMEETLLIKDRVFVNRQSYAFGGPSRGDVIVFRNWHVTGENVPSPSVWTYITRSVKEGIPFINKEKEPNLIKRVIGLPGETLEVKDSIAYINGKKLKEPYIWLDGPDLYANYGPVKIPPGHYFVMGDHRNNSADARANFAVDRDAIVGRAFLRYWPVNRIGGLRGPKK